MVTGICAVARGETVTFARGGSLEAKVLKLTEAAVYTRVLRSDMITVLHSDFIAFARAKGQGVRQILTRHALRPASLSLLTLIGLQLGGAIAGAVVIEQIFALPGLGTMLFAAILSRDLVLVQGGVLLLAVAFVVVNALVEFKSSGRLDSHSSKSTLLDIVLLY